MTDFIDWPGHMGTYRYWFLDMPVRATSIQSVAGNYVFVKPGSNGWVPLYFGIADDLSQRLPSHERWHEAVPLGATHVMAHTNPTKAACDAEESDLIYYWQTPLNYQLREPRTGLVG